MARSILIVDDDPLNIQTFNEILLEDTGSDLEVVNANNGVLGLKIARLLTPDVIITDWEMPEMDGIEFIRQLKNDDTTRDIPVIMASGIMLTSSDLDVALSAGAVDYIRKPIDRVELRARVRSAMEIGDQIKKLRENHSLIISQEKELHQKNVDRLQQELEFKHRELNSNLSFLMQYESDKDQHIIELNKLKPYLNNEGKTRLQQLIHQITEHDNSLSLLELENRFDQVNHKFYEALNEVCPDITKSEKMLSAYTLMNLTPADIVAVTKKNLNSVNVAFSRLRAKLNVSSNTELKDRLVAIAQL